MDLIRKFYTAAKAEINEKERTIVHRLQTEAVDREGEVVLSKGIGLGNYRANPIVLWAHGYSDAPIAKNLWIRHDNQGLIAKTHFATTTKGEEAWQLYKGGFLNGWSIGFIHQRGMTSPPTDREIQSNLAWKSARSIVRECELVEYSACPIPVNPEAVGLAYTSKALKISDTTAKELGIVADSNNTPPPADDPPAHKNIRIYGSSRELERAVATDLDDFDDAEFVENIGKVVQGNVKEAIRLARGGV